MGLFVPRCVSPTDQSTVLHTLVQEPPLSYQAPGSQVTGHDRGRWRQWLSYFLTHHSSGVPLRCHLGFSSPSVWSFLFLLRLLLLGKLRTPPYLGATSLTNQEQLLFFQLPLEGWVPPLLSPSRTAQGCGGTKTITATCSLPADTRRLNTPAQATI